MNSLNPVTRRVTTRGVSLEVRGEGDPVLLLHGIGGSSASCAPLAASLAQHGLRVHSWDAPGYGASFDPADEIELVAELGAVVGEIGGQVHLLGTSWGGVLAMELAITRPGLVASLVVADSSRGSGTSPKRAADMRARVKELAELGPRAVAALRAWRLVSPSCDEPTRMAVAATMAQIRMAGFAAAAEYMASRDLGPLLGRIACPSLVVVGEDDIVTGVDESRLLAAHIPDARLAIIEHAGHAAVTERPDAVAAEVLAAVTGSMRGSAR